MGSLYNLTLDEVQHQLGDLGKPLCSMNLDELLKSVCTAQPASALARQSSINLAQDLRKKTVDEVWQDIQQGQKKNNNITSSYKRGYQERQVTLGEMTLEDFLVKAGIVAGNVDSDVSNEMNINDQQAQWMRYKVPPVVQQEHVYITSQQSLSIGGNAMMEMGYPETHMTVSPLQMMSNLSDTQTPGRKRGVSGEVVEKTVERRQKRMIKNRESAARSRARKQAYTNELEIKISRLEEENERLKRQKDVGMVLPSALPPKPKYPLRRTSSAAF